MIDSVAVASRMAPAGEMLPLLVRHEIQVLLRAGHSQTDVAERVGVSSDSVQRTKAEADVCHVDDIAEPRARGVGRPSKAAPFAGRVIAWLGESPGLPAQELLRRARGQGRATWQRLGRAGSHADQASEREIGAGPLSVYCIDAKWVAAALG